LEPAVIFHENLRLQLHVDNEGTLHYPKSRRLFYFGSYRRVSELLHIASETENSTNKPLATPAPPSLLLDRIRIGLYDIPSLRVCDEYVPNHALDYLMVWAEPLC
jgi:hypothetical protein